MVHVYRWPIEKAVVPEDIRNAMYGIETLTKKYVEHSVTMVIVPDDDLDAFTMAQHIAAMSAKMCGEYTEPKSERKFFLGFRD